MATFGSFSVCFCSFFESLVSVSVFDCKKVMNAYKLQQQTFSKAVHCVLLTSMVSSLYVILNLLFKNVTVPLILSLQVLMISPLW